MLYQIEDPAHQNVAHHTQNDVAVGIDFGTTHCVVSIKKADTVHVLPIHGGGVLLPSIVHYADNGDVSVGNRIQKNTGLFIPSVKRRLSQESLVAPYYLNGQELAFEDIASEIFRHLINLVHEKESSAINKAVVSVPAYFDEVARSKIKKAAQNAGWEILRLINEPTAAALAYGLDQEVEGLYLVYDLGGGTFDVSVLNFQKGVFRVLGTAGNAHLGGDDFDALISLNLMQQTSHLPKDTALKLAREAKEYLSSHQAWQSKFYEDVLTLTTQQFEDIARPLIADTMNICKRLLIDLDLEVGQLKGVILVGGSTRIPFVQQSVHAFFKKPPLLNLDPDTVVSKGAAIQAYQLTRQHETLLLDVTPLSLGIETLGGIVERLIERNSPIPCEQTHLFTTHIDGQVNLKIHVVQGDRELVKDCRSLGTFVLSNIPPLAAGFPRIAVTFRLDVDGLLSVKAKELHTGLSQEMEIKPEYGLQAKEMETMIFEAYLHGQEDMQQRLYLDMILQCEKLLLVVNKALASHPHLLSGDALFHLQHAMSILLAAIKEKKSYEVLGDAKETLEKMCVSFFANEGEINGTFVDIARG